MKKGLALSLSKGFTIVELLLYMALFSVLITIVSNIFMDTMQLQLQSQSTSVVTQNMDYIFARFGYDIYKASGITTPASAGQSGPVLTINISGQSYTYSLSGSNLILTTPAGSFTLNTPDVSVTAFTATHLDGFSAKPNIHIGLTLTSNIVPLGRGPETVSYSSAFTLR